MKPVRLNGFTMVKGVHEDGNIEGKIYINVKEINTIIEVENPKFNEKYSHIIIFKNGQKVLTNMEEVEV